ncbi:unnamed protein product [Caenorhabditis bovis]|uniref:valine--tRNA ligase n=1 Tax=Caenorhabditis bovis TaxID=2654633 RepID=A0A8S1E690_9PELO|nr:unnamed protein product [Caenorhabditis bovis]
MTNFNRIVLSRRNVINPIIFTRESSSSFNIDIATNDYERRTEFAAANYRKNGRLFRMVLPPPNVTGKLHLGHALTVAIEDAICRHRRCQGDKAHWIPGFDHAGIATQAVVEKMLAKKGMKRQEMSREEFLRHCHQWSEICSVEIKKQLSKMGASLDWNQAYYTLDDQFSKAVTTAFCTLHNEGLIFRGKRIVHWCPSLESTLSSQEVNRIEAPESGILTIPGKNGNRCVRIGKMYMIRYKFVDCEEYLEVGTTRPETLFADVAIAVHPDDSRFSKYVGRSVESPTNAAHKLPIIADSSVLRDKGTGAVKITPAHDPLDYEIWQRHKSTIEHDEIMCIDTNGMMINCGPEFDGLDRFEAREKIVEQLSSHGSCRITDYKNAQVNICSRTGDIIEPRLAEQWFLDCREMFENASKAIEMGKIKVHPKYQSHRLIDWFENQEPWCLSRQLVWGHRIPAYKDSKGTKDWVVAESRNEAEQMLGSSDIRQDEDVLDTWFSSSLVPMVRNRPESDEPSLDVMETGWDISGFWVARMIAMNMKLSQGQIPFGTVILHGLVRDSDGRKMSKSLGNVIDPLDVLDGISLQKMIDRVKESALTDAEIDHAIVDLTKRFPNGIDRCGPDALRFALLRYDVLSSDIPLDISTVALEGLRFCNKLWNLAAYYDQLAAKCDNLKDVDSSKLVDEWIMARLASVVSQVDEHMNNYSLHLALSTLHQFITYDICDTYLETTKRALWSNDLKRVAEARTTLQKVLQPTFVQLSAFMPFVTEHLYERIFSREPGSINFDVVKPALFIFYRNAELEESMKLITAAMSAVRSLRSKLQLSSKIVFEGFLKFEENGGLSPRELHSLAKDVTPVCGLDLRLMTAGSEVSKEEFMECPIPGHNATVWIKIEENSKPAFIESLNSQLEKARTRESQFSAKAETYDAICNNPTTKPSFVEKNRRKAENARKVAANAREEANRIEKIIMNQK